MSKGKFYLVTGIGHCGTQWLANALHYPERGISATHEGIRRWCHRKYALGSWKDSALYYLEHGVDQRFDCYFAELDKLLNQYRIIIDAHSWIPSAVPEVAKRVEVSGVIHLVRNGIQNIHSLYETDHGEPEFWFCDVIRYESERIGFDLIEGDEWTYWCDWWAANTVMVDWLKGQGIDTRVYRLDGLITSLDTFALLTDWLDIELPRGETQRRQAVDWNRHIMGDRMPVRLLTSWSRGQQETFLAICGEAMRRLGYL